MPDVVVSALAGAVGGILVVLGERFLFSAPSAWHGLTRSGRFYRLKFWQWRGHRVTYCPACLRPEPEPVVDPVVLPNGWEEIDGPNTHWLRCPECGNVWWVKTVITKFSPVENESD